MKTTRRKMIGIAVATTLAAAAGTAVLAHGGGAGSGYGPGAGHGSMMGSQGMGGGHGMMGGYDGARGHGPMMGGGRMGPQGQGPGDPVAFAEQRLESFKAQLDITAAQQPAWNAFADTLRGQAEAVQEHREAMAGGQGVRFTERFAWMQAGAARMGTVAAAANELYAVLTPEQQARADAITAGGCWQ